MEGVVVSGRGFANPGRFVGWCVGNGYLL
jgi:hypothetical protein